MTYEESEKGSIDESRKRYTVWQKHSWRRLIRTWVFGYSNEGFELSIRGNIRGQVKQEASKRERLE